MTDLGPVLSAVTAYGDALVAEQKTKDDALLYAARAELADAQHRISDLVDQANIQAQTITRLETEVSALTPKPPTLFGYAVHAGAGETKADALARQTANLGAPQVIRHFFDNAPLTYPVVKGAYGNTPLVLSYKRNPADVAAGKIDAEVAAFLDSLPTDRPTWVSGFDHENDKKVQDGVYTAAQSKVAWEHVARMVKAHPNKQLRTVLILVGYGIETRMDPLLPSDLSLLDVLAVDPYAAGATRDVARQMQPMLDAAARIAKPLAIGETQNNQGTDDERAAYYTAQLDLARANAYPFVCFFPGTNVPAFTREAFPKSTAVWRDATS